MDQARTNSAEPRLGLWDAVSIIVGIIIGVGIFETPHDVFSRAPGPWSALGVWAVGGVLALIGALCFAELASAYPRSGGEYVYLTRAFGPVAGFLFGWAQLGLIRPASIGALAFVFAKNAAVLWGVGEGATVLLAAGSVALLTVINILGVTLGKNTQNLLTVAKLLGLAAIVVVGFGWGSPREIAAAAPVVGAEGWFATTMIFVLWTYAGWHEAAYIVAEVKDRHRNIPLALIVGTAAVTVIYLAINVAFLFALGFEDARHTTVPAQMVLELVAGRSGATVMSLLIMVSALGAINGMIFTTARIYTEFGADHRLFQPLSKWSRRWGTPVRALVTQGAISLAMVAGVSVWVHWKGAEVPTGQIALEEDFHTTIQNTLENLWYHVSGPDVPAEAVFHKKIKDAFEKMVEVPAAVFWLFFLLTGVSLMVLRAKDPDLPRPFRVPGYPILPVVFCLWCGYMAYGSIRFKPDESLIGLAILLIGLAFYFLPKKIKRSRVKEPEPTPAGVA